MKTARRSTKRTSRTSTAPMVLRLPQRRTPARDAVLAARLETITVAVAVAALVAVVAVVVVDAALVRAAEVISKTNEEARTKCPGLFYFAAGISGRLGCGYIRA